MWRQAVQWVCLTRIESMEDWQLSRVRILMKNIQEKIKQKYLPEDQKMFFVAVSLLSCYFCKSFVLFKQIFLFKQILAPSNGFFLCNNKEHCWSLLSRILDTTRQCTYHAVKQVF